MHVFRDFGGKNDKRNINKRVGRGLNWPPVVEWYGMRVITDPLARPVSECDQRTWCCWRTCSHRLDKPPDAPECDCAGAHAAGT